MNLALIVFLVSGFAFDLSAEQQKPEAANSALDWKAWLDDRAGGFSGVALIARGDAIQIVSANGLADRSTGRRNTAETRFNLGSINKTFTAIAAAQLIQQGRLSLDDTLAKYIPDYPNREAAAKITIRDLVTHRSGIAPFVRADFGDAATAAEMAKVAGSKPQAFEPGARQEYSNGGYVVLGRIVEVVSGQSYATYVSDHIYRPAGMTSTGFVAKGERDPSIAMGYFSVDDQGRPVMGGQTGLFGFNPPEPGNPAGGGYSTAADLFRFSRALRGGRLLDQRMTDSVLNGTFSGQSGPKFGFALKEQMAGTRRFIGNGGGAPGVNAEFRFEPAGDFTVVVLANSSPPAATKLLGDILDRLGPGGAEARTPQPSVRMPEMSLPELKFPVGKTVVEVPFEAQGNWMVIPVSINGSRPLRFVLDTGAQGTSLRNSDMADTLNLEITGTMAVRGAGGGGAGRAASIAEHVTFNIGGIELSNGHLVLSPPSSGPKSVATHDGVIGRIVFATLVVEVDWERHVLRLSKPASYKYQGSGTIVPLTFDEGGRPYAIASVGIADEKLVPVKLVVDTGGGHALSLDAGSRPEIKAPESAPKVVLGRGASGEITGSSGRVRKFQIGGHTLADVPAVFPDSSSGTAGVGGRNGNLGAGVLRRFNVVYDYSRKQMIVEPNKDFANPFGTAIANDVAGSTVKMPSSALQEYIGTYGNKEISIQDRGLYYKRTGGRGAALRAVGSDKFALNTDAQITFVRDANGVVSEMVIEWVDRDKELLKRERNGP